MYSATLVLLVTVASVSAFAPLPNQRWGTPKSFITSNNMNNNNNRLAAAFSFPEDNNNHLKKNNKKQSSKKDDVDLKKSVSSFDLRRAELRRKRMAEEAIIKSRFVTGDALHDMRKQVLKLKRQLDQARSNSRGSSSSAKRGDVVDTIENTNNNIIEQLQQAILRAQQMDPEYIYHVSLARQQQAAAAASQNNGVENTSAKTAQEYAKQAALARSALPQFNLEGLWVGKYGDHGFEMINVTYVGDVLMAYKVTGDRTVPKGELSFTANLSPTLFTPASSSGKSSASTKQRQHQPTRRRRWSWNKNNNDEEEEEEDHPKSSASLLEPIELGTTAAQQWGSRYLTRFAGAGQVASPGFVEPQMLAGELILVGQQYFSFAWLPIGHQVFFGRPSPELTLKLLREHEQAQKQKHADATTHTMVDYLERCLEETDLLQDEMEVADEFFPSHNQQDYYAIEGCFD